MSNYVSMGKVLTRLPSTDPNQPIKVDWTTDITSVRTIFYRRGAVIYDTDQQQLVLVNTANGMFLQPNTSQRPYYPSGATIIPWSSKWANQGNTDLNYNGLIVPPLDLDGALSIMSGNNVMVYMHAGNRWIYGVDANHGANFSEALSFFEWLTRDSVPNDVFPMFFIMRGTSSSMSLDLSTNFSAYNDYAASVCNQLSITDNKYVGGWKHYYAYVWTIGGNKLLMKAVYKGIGIYNFIYENMGLGMSGSIVESVSPCGSIINLDKAVKFNGGNVNISVSIPRFATRSISNGVLFQISPYVELVEDGTLQPYTLDIDILSISENLPHPSVGGYDTMRFGLQHLHRYRSM